MTRFILAGFLVLTLACPVVLMAQERQLQEDDVVAKRGGVVLTVGMVDQKVASMPEGIREGYFDEAGRVARLIDSVLLTAQLAQEAEKRGLTIDVPNDTSELDRMTAKANAVLQQQGVLQSDEDYLVLAKERYQARKKDYASQEEFTLQHVFVNGATRGQVAAKIVAEAALQRALEGEDFSELVKEYSEAEAGDPLNGTIDLASAVRLTAPLQGALSGFDRKPGISKVIEDGAGYHIIRLVEYHAPVIPPFDEIQGQIIAQLKEESIISAKTTFMRDLSLQDVELNDPVVQGLATRYHRSGDSSGVKILTDMP